MPYINATEVKAIRKELKNELPYFKFSVRKSGSSTVQVTIVQSPIEMRKDISNEYENVNHFYIREKYKVDHQYAIDPDKDIRVEVLQKIKCIAAGNQRIIVEDGDYGSVPNYYVDIRIGRWDKPFTVNTDLVK